MEQGSAQRIRGGIAVWALLRQRAQQDALITIVAFQHIVPCVMMAIPAMLVWVTPTPLDLAIAGGRVYWTSSGDGTLTSCPVGGCGAEKPRLAKMRSSGAVNAFPDM